MTVRSVGVEEELLLVDPATRQAAPCSEQVLEHPQEHALPSRRHPRAQGHEDDLDQELFRHQVETRTGPSTDLGETFQQLVEARRAADRAARGAGVRVIASGTLPMSAGAPQVTRDERYEDMAGTFGELLRAGTTCGMHVHVSIDSEEEGIEVIDAIAPWLPLVLALSANSPMVSGRDTGHASWRSQVFTRWPSAGPTEPFGSLENYREVSRRLIESGAARDQGMLYFDARLSEQYPTVEVRVADVTATPADAVTVAAIVRGLVSAAATGTLPGSRDSVERTVPWSCELLRAAHWRAARYGLSGSLQSPRSGRLAPAREVVADLMATVGSALAEADDLELAARGVDHLLRATGATLQRAAFEGGGTVEAVVDDLVVRTLTDGREPS